MNAVQILNTEKANHIFANQHTCTCGFEPTDENGWYDHISRAQIAALVHALREEYSDWNDSNRTQCAHWVADLLEGKAGA